MTCRLLSAALAALAILTVANSPVHAAAPPCSFTLGFAALENAIPDVVGQCVENQVTAANGDTTQHTTNGLLVWSKASNETAFTDGYRTWFSTPEGVQVRYNSAAGSPEVTPIGPGGIGFLSAPPYAQQQISSCEIAAASVVLNLMGQPVSEVDLWAHLAHDSRNPEMNSAGVVTRWGDPGLGFVGNIDGAFPWNGETTAQPGYGVYAGPLLAAVHQFDPGASGGAHMPIGALLAALAQGRPSIVWLPDQWDFQHEPDATTTGSWQSWSGAAVTFAYREHTQVLLGHDPNGFVVGNVGYQQTRIPYINRWSDADFAAGYGVLGNMAITV